MAKKYDFSSAAKVVNGVHTNKEMIAEVARQVQQVENALQYRAEELLMRRTNKLASMLQQAKDAVPHTSLDVDFIAVDFREYWHHDLVLPKGDSFGSINEWRYTARSRRFEFSLNDLETDFRVCASLSLKGLSFNEHNTSEREAFQRQFKRSGAAHWPTRLVYGMYMLNQGCYAIFPDAKKDALGVQCADVDSIAALLQRFIKLSVEGKLIKTRYELYGYIR